MKKSVMENGKMLRAIGIDPRIVDIINNLYKNTECAVAINLQVTKWRFKGRWVLDKVVFFYH